MNPDDIEPISKYQTAIEEPASEFSLKHLLTYLFRFLTWHFDESTNGETCDTEFKDLPLVIQSFFEQNRSLHCKNFSYYWQLFGHTLVRYGPGVKTPIKNKDEKILFFLDGKPFTYRDKKILFDEIEPLHLPDYPMMRGK